LDHWRTKLGLNPNKAMTYANRFGGSVNNALFRGQVRYYLETPRSRDRDDRRRRQKHRREERDPYRRLASRDSTTDNNSSGDEKYFSQRQQASLQNARNMIGA
jgi:hypothetical protein